MPLFSFSLLSADMAEIEKNPRDASPSSSYDHVEAHNTAEKDVAAVSGVEPDADLGMLFIVLLYSLYLTFAPSRNASRRRRRLP
jgi:hypothetical protein